VYSGYAGALSLFGVIRLRTVYSARGICLWHFNHADRPGPPFWSRTIRPLWRRPVVAMSDRQPLRRVNTNNCVCSHPGRLRPRAARTLSWAWHSPFKVRGRVSRSRAPRLPLYRAARVDQLRALPRRHTDLQPGSLNLHRPVQAPHTVAVKVGRTLKWHTGAEALAHGLAFLCQ
jgi:hypothetical protein